MFEELTIERGKALTWKFPRDELTIEHFGFQDGISQPIVVQQDLDAELARCDGPQWNVKAFWETIDALHGQLVAGQPRLQPDDVGAPVVGRYPDGIPTRRPAGPRGRRP